MVLSSVSHRQTNLPKKSAPEVIEASRNNKNKKILNTVRSVDAACGLGDNVPSGVTCAIETSATVHKRTAITQTVGFWTTTGHA